MKSLALLVARAKVRKSAGEIEGVVIPCVHPEPSPMKPMHICAVTMSEGPEKITVDEGNSHNEPVTLLFLMQMG